MGYWKEKRRRYTSGPDPKLIGERKGTIGNDGLGGKRGGATGKEKKKSGDTVPK